MTSELSFGHSKLRAVREAGERRLKKGKYRTFYIFNHLTRKEYLEALPKF